MWTDGESAKSLAFLYVLDGSMQEFIIKFGSSDVALNLDFFWRGYPYLTLSALQQNLPLQPLQWITQCFSSPLSSTDTALSHSHNQREPSLQRGFLRHSLLTF